MLTDYHNYLIANLVSCFGSANVCRRPLANNFTIRPLAIHQARPGRQVIITHTLNAISGMAFLFFRVFLGLAALVLISFCVLCFCFVTI